MHILVISQYFYPETFRVNALCRELVDRGHDVTVMTAYPQYPGGRIYAGYGFRIPYEHYWHGVRIERVKTYPRGRTPFGLLLNCMSYVYSGIKWVKHCTQKFDAIYVFEVSPVTVGLPAVAYKKKFGTPILFNVQDLWPESVEEVLNVRFRPVIEVINKIVDTIYAHSDKILCASNGFVNHLEKRGVKRDKLVFWPQFCMAPVFSEQTRPEIYTQDAFNVVFTGNIGDAQGLDLLVEAAKELKGEGIRWYLVGDGRARQRLEKLVSEYDVCDDVIFVGKVSESEANRYAHFADCAYLSFRNIPLFKMTVPAKLQTYQACSVPILAAAGGESAEVIERAQCGIAVPPQLDALVEGVRRMKEKTRAERLAMGKAGFQYYLKHYTMDKLIGDLEQMMLDVCNLKQEIKA